MTDRFDIFNRNKMKNVIKSFINVTLLLLTSVSYAQYGINEKAGHYLNVDDAKIYYEVYAQGRPLLLLHGGLYGYINERR